MTGCHVMGGCCTELYWVLLSCGVRVRAEEWIPTLKAARTELTKSIENPFWLWAAEAAEARRLWW